MELGKITLAQAKKLSPKFVEHSLGSGYSDEFDPWEIVAKLKKGKLALVHLGFGGQEFKVVRISSVKLNQPPEGAPLVRVADNEASWRVSSLALLE